MVRLTSAIAATLLGGACNYASAECPDDGWTNHLLINGMPPKSSNTASWEKFEWSMASDPGTTTQEGAGLGKGGCGEGDTWFRYFWTPEPWGCGAGWQTGAGGTPVPMFPDKAKHMCIEYNEWAEGGAVADAWKIELNDDLGNKAATFDAEIDVSGATAISDTLFADLVANPAGDHGTGKTPQEAAEAAGMPFWQLTNWQIITNPGTGSEVKKDTKQSLFVSNVWVSEKPCAKSNMCCPPDRPEKTPATPVECMREDCPWAWDLDNAKCDDIEKTSKTCLADCSGPLRKSFSMVICERCPENEECVAIEYEKERAAADAAAAEGGDGEGESTASAVAASTMVFAAAAAVVN